MFFILSKILFYVAMPIFWILGLVVAAWIVKETRLKIRLFSISAILLIVLTNPFLVNEAWLLLEVEPKPLSEIGDYDAAIVLTGVTSAGKSPHDRVYFNKGADRIFHPLMLYRKGKIKKFIITGGSGSLVERKSTEAQDLKEFLLYANVPEEDIIIEERSKNTRENAAFTKELLSRNPELKKLLLVTSGFHMRRSLGCFQKQGVEVEPFSTDFYSHDRNFYPNDIIIPKEYCLGHWQTILHEAIGIVTYSVLGYM